MKQIDVDAIRSDMHARWRFLCDFVGYGDDDRQAIRESAGILGPQLARIVDDLYEHLLAFDDTRRRLVGDQEASPAVVESRKDHLAMWVLKSIEGDQSPWFAPYLQDVGRLHSGSHGDPRRSVPPRYMVAFISVIQTRLAKAIFEALPDDPAQACRLHGAWQKLLNMQLELMLKFLVPHFPQWDEATT